MRTTLRVLSQEEIVVDVGVGFDIILDTVNSFDPAILVRKPGRGDPILYFYEDFLQVFDPAARERYGVYYTPIEVVTYMVAALDRTLRENLGTAGLIDDAVTLLDPATGTGTFLLGVIESVRASVEVSAGLGAVPGALRALALRLFGFELLVGPYAVAHYRLRHAIGTLQANQRIGVFLADTLAEPGAAAPVGRLGFVAENIRTERHEADRVKQGQPILAIIGNPPYRRLEAGEIGELVGTWMNDLWDEFKSPVREAGGEISLTHFQSSPLRSGVGRSGNYSRATAPCDAVSSRSFRTGRFSRVSPTLGSVQCYGSNLTASRLSIYAATSAVASARG